MSDSYDSDKFPVEIKLGQKVPDYSSPAGAAPTKPSKTRMSYPSLYIDGGPDLAKFQKDGWALIKYHRHSVRLGESGGPASGDDEAGKDKASVELEVREICLPDKGDDMADDFASFAKKAGVNTEGMGGDDESDGEQSDESEET